VQLGTPINTIRLSPEGWHVFLGGRHAGESVLHSAILYAGTAGRLAQLRIVADGIPSLAPLAKVHHPPVASIVLGFRREDVAHPLDGFGMLIPRAEHCHTLGTIFSSTLFPGRAPAGHVTLTSYIGGARQPELALKSAATLEELAMADLRRLLGVKGEPVFRNHFVYPHAIPQYNIGFGEVRQLLTQLENSAPGLFLAGHYRNGISLGDSIVAGDDVAERIARHQDWLETARRFDIPGRIAA
jgi:oxygen-dependent protoporphyrinogen oxidase